MKNHNFMKLFVGRSVTNAGGSLYAIASVWLVYTLNGSTVYTGLAGFLTMLPQLFRPLASSFVERWLLKKTLVITQITELILVLSIPTINYTGRLNIAIVLIVMPAIQAAEQFASLAETGALPQVLHKKDLVKGNSALSFAYGGIDLAFKSISGVLITSLGAIAIYLVDSFTFTIAMMLFLALKIPRKNTGKKSNATELKTVVKKYRDDLMESSRFVLGSVISKLLIGSTIANFAFGIAMAVMPPYANTRGGALIYGIIMAVFAGGFFVREIWAIFAFILKKSPIGLLVITSFALSSLLWISSAFIPWGSLSIIMFGLALVPLGAAEVTMGVAVQKMIPARTFSIVTSISSTAALPIGSLLGGLLGAIFSPRMVFTIGGIGIFIVAMLWFVISDLRGIPQVGEIDSQSFGLNKKLPL